MDSENIVVRVNYRRQTQPKQYETAAFEMTVEETFPASLSPLEIESVGKQLAQVVKVGVYRELNLPFEQDEDTKVIMEVFPGSEVVAETRKAAPAPPSAPTGARRNGPGRSVPSGRSGPAQRPTAPPSGPEPAYEIDTNAAWEDLAANPSDWYYYAPEDKKNPKGPDFRNKSGRFKSQDGRFLMGLWLNTKPEDLVLPDDVYANG